MEFHVLLVIVLVITFTSVLARPKDTVSRQIRATEGIEPPESGGLTMKLPIPLQEDWIMSITGTMLNSSQGFEIIVPSKTSTENYYEFKYNFEEKIYNLKYLHIDVPEENVPYRLFGPNEQPSENPLFNLDIIGGKNNFTVSVNLNQAGPITGTVVDVKGIEDWDRIEFRLGLHSITSIVMKMSPSA